MLLYYCYTWKDTFFALVTILEGAPSRVGWTTVLTSDHPQDWRFLKYRFYCLRMVDFICPTMYLTHPKCKGRWFPVLWYCPNVNVQFHLCNFWCFIVFHPRADYDDIVLFVLYSMGPLFWTVLEPCSLFRTGARRHDIFIKFSSRLSMIYDTTRVYSRVFIAAMRCVFSVKSVPTIIGGD